MIIKFTRTKERDGVTPATRIIEGIREIRTTRYEEDHMIRIKGGKLGDLWPPVYVIGPLAPTPRGEINLYDKAEVFTEYGTLISTIEWEE